MQWGISNPMVLKILQLYIYIIMLRAILSWFDPNPRNPFTRLIYTITEPVLSPVRKMIPPIGGRLDISPIIVFIAAVLLKTFLLR